MNVDRKRKHETYFRAKMKMTEKRKSVIFSTENENEFRSVSSIKLYLLTLTSPFAEPQQNWEESQLDGINQLLKRNVFKCDMS